jgi:hypothetical protein
MRTSNDSSATEGGRMKRPRLNMMQVTTGIAVVALFFTGSGPVSSATAQTIGSTYAAYIDGKANSDANELARKAADETARGFTCGKDEVKVIGASGRAVELATRR